MRDGRLATCTDETFSTNIRKTKVQGASDSQEIHKAAGQIHFRGLGGTREPFYRLDSSS